MRVESKTEAVVSEILYFFWLLKDKVKYFIFGTPTIYNACRHCGQSGGKFGLTSPWRCQDCEDRAITRKQMEEVTDQAKEIQQDYPATA